MRKVQKYKRGISAFISSDKGQRFFNFAYSIGAAIVIWGALFKILHLPGGNTLLSLGMGTEVLMFILTAFDRPPQSYKWENVFPALHDNTADPINVDQIVQDGSARTDNTVYVGPHTVTPGVARRVVGIPDDVELSHDDTRSLSDSIAKMAAAADTLANMADLADATKRYLSQMDAIAADMEQLHNTTAALNNVSATLLDSYRAITDNSEAISQSSLGYVDQMQALHHNIGGLNAIYELQLRSVSSQIEAIDRVNRGIKDIRDMYEKSANQSVRYCEETEKMARYMQQLNSIYERMISAMTVNMYNPAMGAINIPQPDTTTDKTND